MSQERKQVLDMLAQGKITAEDAERLLDKLASLGSTPEGAADADAGAKPWDTGTTPPPAAKGKPKYLRVVVDGSDGDKVNIRVPLGLVRAGMKLRAVMPEHARERLERKGFDLNHLSELDGEELVDALRDLSVDVDSENGDKVRIFCE